MRKVPIGSSEGRRFYAQRALVRERLAAARRAESACIFEDLSSSPPVKRFAGGVEYGD